ncbi:MAG: hypothetical protein P1U89_27935 [Verrucomicrobiales bacterium]|nr:hypothetical protein [Verrucomicrobiales bacterium]
MHLSCLSHEFARKKSCRKRAAEKELPKKQQPEKAAARKRDAERIKQGESPDKIQEENSIFPSGYFAKAKIENLASTVGK